MGNEVIPYDASLPMVEQAKKQVVPFKKIDELIQFDKKYMTLLQYAKKRRESQEVQNFLTASLAYARRKMGQIIPKEFPHGGDRKSSTHYAYLKLSDIGIEDTAAVRWQQLAEIPESVFDKTISEEKILSFNKLLGLARQLKRKKALEVEFITGRFQDVCAEWPEGKIDHIITDPPYPEEYLQEWSDLSRAAAQILKPGGFCICYAGKYWLPQYLNRLGEHLEYYWQLILLHKGPPSGVHPVRINTRYKPILIFQKPPRTPQADYVSDLIQGSGREKDMHEWQQGEEEVKQILERFTNKGDMILDPFAGSGTIGMACKRYERNCILIEANPRV